MLPIRYFLYYWNRLNKEYLQILKTYANKPLEELELAEYLRQLPQWLRENFKLWNEKE